MVDSTRKRQQQGSELRCHFNGVGMLGNRDQHTRLYTVKQTTAPHLAVLLQGVRRSRLHENTSVIALLYACVVTVQTKLSEAQGSETSYARH